MVLNENILLKKCKSLSFGKIIFDEKENLFYKTINNEILDLCRSLPVSQQFYGIDFVMIYSKSKIGEPLNFFDKFYPPLWSIIYHLSNLKPDLKINDIQNSLKAQSLTMFLHSLDDHLNDGEIPVSHLMLLLRSNAWLKLIGYINILTENIPDLKDFSKNSIDTYYEGINSTNKVNNLEEYCELFKKQMGTVVIIPIILANMINRSNDFIENVKNSFFSFGVAWRLLDDINDIEEDLNNLTQTSIYYLLSDGSKKIWDKINKNESDLIKIFDKIENEDIIYKIIDRIFEEFKKASNYANDINLNKLSVEYDELIKPLLERKIK